MLNPLGLQVKRMARRVVWPRPGWYCLFGILRNRGNIFRADYQLYISGYPRSGNTFAVKAFGLVNPNVRVRSHKHIPSFIVHSARQNAPGMVLIRNPIDAAISWSIFMNEPLQETLAYYSDFHSVLLPYRDALFFVPFGAVIEDFGKVITAFNARWHTDYVPFPHTAENVSRCLAAIEAEYADANGDVPEMKVPRPSAQRRAQREHYLRQLNRSAVQKELLRANELYHRLAPKNSSARKPAHKTNTTQSIRLPRAV